VLVLALDTATPAVIAGVVELTPHGVVPRSVRVAHDARKHGELLLPGVLVACADAGVSLRDLDAVVVGIGPGPFTGLRVGMVTAAALGDALGVPVHGVGSLDAIAAEVTLEVPFVVATDARRREVYWAAYAPGDGAGASPCRTDGPHVQAPGAVVAPDVVAAAGAAASALGLPAVPPAAPGPVGLVSCALDALRTGREPGPLVPLYLRRPDAVAPGSRKPVLR
jgi:tRNA threonylcarbamoyl adenosine modification protein YeaZ